MSAERTGNAPVVSMQRLESVQLPGQLSPPCQKLLAQGAQFHEMNRFMEYLDVVWQTASRCDIDRAHASDDDNLHAFPIRRARQGAQHAA